MGFRVDIKPENKPDIVADCDQLPLRDNLDLNLFARMSQIRLHFIRDGNNPS